MFACVQMHLMFPTSMVKEICIGEHHFFSFVDLKDDLCLVASLLKSNIYLLMSIILTSNGAAKYKMTTFGKQML